MSKAPGGFILTITYDTMQLKRPVIIPTSLIRYTFALVLSQRAIHVESFQEL